MNSYKNYKESNIDWIGNIPQHWEVTKPKYKLTRVTRPTEKNDEVITCFRDGVVTLRKNRRVEGFTISLKEHGYQQIHPGDLVVHEMDGFEGAIGISDSKGKSTPVYTVIEPNQTTDLRYISYLLRVMSKSGKIESMARSIRERTTDFRWNMWSVLYFPFPPLQEQTLISNYLDTKTKEIDLLIKKIEKKIELLKEQKSTLINKYVSKGFDLNKEMKDSGMDWVGNIPKHWKMGKFKYIISFLTDYTSNGSFKSLAENVKYLDDGYSRLIRLTDLRKNFKNKGVYISQQSHNFLRKSELFGNEILIANVGSVGVAIKMPLNQGKCSLAPNMYLIRHHTANTDLDYVVFLLNSNVIQNQLKLVITSTAQPKINKDNLKSLQILMPPLEEQKQIANYLLEKNKQIDLIISKEIERKSLIIEYRKSLIYSIITGKIRITEDII